MFHEPVSINYRHAIGRSLQQQIPTIVLWPLLLDGGMMLRVSLVATIAFWLFAMIILVRSERFQEPKTDRDGLLFLRWGYFPLFLAFLLANQFVNPAWNAKSRRMNTLPSARAVPRQTAERA